MQQGSEEWLQIRCGKVTASCVRNVTAKTKTGGATVGRRDYLADLVGERLSGTPEEQYVNAAMLYGTEKEPAARFAYALTKGVEITEVGFVPHPSIDMAGASPDGLVGSDGLVEIKCPWKKAHHIDRLVATERTGWGIIPEYFDQMQFQMACTRRAWCDFVSYDDRFPEEMQLVIRRIARDDRYIADMETQVVLFLNDVTATVELLRKRFPRIK